jgi:hypothetical protein
VFSSFEIALVQGRTETVHSNPLVALTGVCASLILTTSYASVLAVKRLTLSENHSKMWRKIFDNLGTDSNANMAFSWYVLFKICTEQSLIVLLYNHQRLQLALTIINSATYAVIVLRYRPFKGFYSNILAVLLEINQIGTYANMLVMYERNFNSYSGSSADTCYEILIIQVIILSLLNMIGLFLSGVQSIVELKNRIQNKLANE